VDFIPSSIITTPNAARMAGALDLKRLPLCHFRYSGHLLHLSTLRLAHRQFSSSVNTLIRRAEDPSGPSTPSG